MKFLKPKVLMWYTVVMFALTLFFVFGADSVIRQAAEGKTFTNPVEIRYRKVGLLLGTSKYLVGGGPNMYYAHRLDAAAELFKAGKISFILVSGDNATREYNEPITMQSDLVKRGVPKEKIYLDYAGFRTYDSMVRLREIFGQDSVTVISQKFHNERAIYLAQKEHIDAIGYNALDVPMNSGFKTQLREKLARAKVFIDYTVGTKPKFLGEKVEIK
jgi:SanA protein